MKRKSNKEVKMPHTKSSCIVKKWKEVITKEKNRFSPGMDGIQNCLDQENDSSMGSRS